MQMALKDEDVDLMLCPFCDSKAKSVATDTIGFRIKCTGHDCTANVYGYTREEAVGQWNRRVPQ